MYLFWYPFMTTIFQYLLNNVALKDKLSDIFSRINDQIYKQIQNDVFELNNKKSIYKTSVMK